jgi:hypothetical protein
MLHVDSYTIVFEDHVDAVKFCLQVYKKSKTISSLCFQVPYHALLLEFSTFLLFASCVMHDKSRKPHTSQYFLELATYETLQAVMIPECRFNYYLQNKGGLGICSEKMTHMILMAPAKDQETKQI